MHVGLWWVNLKENNHLEDLDIGGRIFEWSNLLVLLKGGHFLTSSEKDDCLN